MSFAAPIVEGLTAATESGTASAAEAGGGSGNIFGRLGQFMTGAKGEGQGTSPLENAVGKGSPIDDVDGIAKATVRPLA